MLTLNAHFLNTYVTFCLVLLDDCPRCWWFLVRPWKFKEWETENLTQHEWVNNVPWFFGKKINEKVSKLV